MTIFHVGHVNEWVMVSLHFEFCSLRVNPEITNSTDYRTSCSMAEYFRSRGMGCSSPSSSIWLNTKPRPESEASVCRINILFQSGVSNTGNSVNIFFNGQKDCSQVGVHWTSLSILFQVHSVRGVAIVETFGMNLL